MASASLLSSLHQREFEQSLYQQQLPCRELMDEVQTVYAAKQNIRRIIQHPSSLTRHFLEEFIDAGLHQRNTPAGQFSDKSHAAGADDFADQTMLLSLTENRSTRCPPQHAAKGRWRWWMSRCSARCGCPG
jgi:hypothetical protein